jgi:hypothetical protein
MAVEVRNTWGLSLHADSVVDISNLGRQVLLSSGIDGVDAWDADDLESTGQAKTARALNLGPLTVGESRTVYFKVAAANARAGTPAVQFHLYRGGGVPDAVDPMRFNQRKIFVAEVVFDFATNEAVARVPEGELRLNLKSVIADRRGMDQVCRLLVRGRGAAGHREERLLESIRRGSCGERTLKDLVALLCTCLNGDEDARCRCDGQFLWLPVEYEMTVTTGGFVGQFGPLPFQDPWWKLLMLVIAVLALLVAAVAALTGLGESRPGARIGTVGAASLTNVDAAIIELDGTRTVNQSVADAVTGEPTQNPKVALDAVIPIDPRGIPANNALLGHHVFKSGARTGLTHGVVTSVTAPIIQCRGEWDDATNTCTPNPDRPNLTLTNQIEIGRDPAIGEITTDEGDSGSLWLSDEAATRNQLVGLTHSGDGDVSTASPIQDVLDALNLRLQA